MSKNIRKKNIIVSVVFWISIYLLIVLAPLIVLNTGELPKGSGFWWDFSMALGFSGMAMMSVQFFLTARFKYATAPFGIDIIYYFHRYLAIAAFIFISLHYFIIVIDNKEALGVINPFEASWYMTAGRISLFLFMLLILSSLFRKQLKIKYEIWRVLHILMAVTAFILALVHIKGVGYYISGPEKQWLWTTYTLFFVFLVFYIRLVKPWIIKRHPYKVIEVTKEHGRSYTIALKPEGHAGMNFKAGQFAWLTLKDSPFHIKEHPFSISSSPSDKNRIEFTIKELGDFTKTIKDTVIGDIAYLDGPYGSFSIDNYSDAHGFVFVSAGVGVAPIMSMLRSMVDKKDKREIVFLNINNNLQSIIFRNELEEMQNHLNLKLIYLLTKADNSWQGERGHITKELFQRILPENFTKLEYFICGPKPVSDIAQKELYGLKVPLSKIHFELFDMV
ncbi:MAG: ferric reductase-like transmembrane domain-containing protein [Sulfurimonas sp.]|nr:ferric reductase-like transmembrane domain-containing protein [Sulfurimonas sp.]